jgi:hypothetical protein
LACPFEKAFKAEILHNAELFEKRVGISYA